MRQFATVGMFATVAALALSGCSAQQVAADEAVIAKGLTDLEDGFDWAAANAPAIKAGIQKVAALDPGNPTLQKIATQATAAIDAGDLAKAKTLVHAGGAAFAMVTAATAPVPAPSPSPAAK